MQLNTKINTLTKISDITIPDRFFDRMKTGYADLDNIFGNGILPGLTFTLTAPPGCGKTRFSLQLLESLQKNGYKTAYITGEEDLRQIAYNCKQLNVSNISVTNEVDINKIEKICAQSNIIIIDSFPCITTRKKFNSRAHEKYITNKFIEMSEKYNCAIGIILHITKAGSYKGSTYVAHAVGANFQISVNQDDDSLRDIISTKNRYGAAKIVSIPFGYGGYNFNEVRERSTRVEKKNDNMMMLGDIIDMVNLNSVKKHDIITKLQITSTKAYTLLKELTDTGKLIKVGRGDNAVWKKSNLTINIGDRRAAWMTAGGSLEAGAEETDS